MHGGEARHPACMRLALFQPGPGLLGTAALNKSIVMLGSTQRSDGDTRHTKPSINTFVMLDALTALATGTPW